MSTAGFGPRSETSEISFYWPGLKNQEEAETFWEATRKFAEEQTGSKIKNRRIFRLEYVHDGKRLIAEVGQPDPYEHEIIRAILEASDIFFICTDNRCVLRGYPILAGRHDTNKVVYFSPKMNE